MAYQRFAIAASMLEYRRLWQGRLGRLAISRSADDYKQAGDRYRSFENRECYYLVANNGDDMKQ